MAGITYVLDTNAITAILKKDVEFVNWLNKEQGNSTLYICQPADYEIKRGILAKNAVAQLRAYQKIKLNFQWLALEDEDWEQAAQFWADTKTKGKQLSDVDLLLAAAVYRRNAVLVSSDTDFDALTINREDWRKP